MNRLITDILTGLFIFANLFALLAVLIAPDPTNVIRAGFFIVGTSVLMLVYHAITIVDYLGQLVDGDINSQKILITIGKILNRDR